MTNTIIANNTAPIGADDFDQRGDVTSFSNNLVEDPNGHTITSGTNGNIVGMDPMLDVLADNGGPTQTMALLTGSPAIDAGLNTGAPATDQRGVSRPQGTIVDIGAFELAVASHAPVANNLSVTTDEDTAVSGTVTASDPDGDTLTFSVVAQAKNGTLQFNTDGTFTYTPNANFQGNDSFDFVASDGTNTSNVAQVSITVQAVNDPPMADNVSITIDEDQLAQGTLTATDADGDTLTFARATVPSHGVAAVRPDGTYLYQPDYFYNGPDSFTFTVTDGTATITRTVTITINAVNDPAYAENQTITTDEDTAYNGQVTAVEVEEDPVTFTLESDPSHGTAIVNIDGTFTYTPAADYNGDDSFTFRAADNQGASTVGTVTVTVQPVNDAPVANNDSYSVDEDQTLTIATPTPVSSLTMQSKPGDYVGDGMSYSYTTANAGFSGNDNFDHGATILVNTTDGTSQWRLDFAAPFSEYLTPGLYLDAMRFGFQDANKPGLEVSGDGRGENALTGQFLVYEVAYNADKSDITSFAARFEQHGITAEGVQPGLFGTILFNSYLAAQSGVLANDTDVDDDLLRAILISGPSHGALTLNADGSLSYTPDPDFSGEDQFTYKVNDGITDSKAATVFLTVNPVNDAPVAAGQALATNEDTPLTDSVSATDVDGDPLTYAVTSGPSHGSLMLNPDTGVFTYTPATNFNGSDVFTFKANDGTTDSTSATVSLTVNSVNDAPVASGQTLATDEDTPLNGSVSATDVDGDTLTYAVTSGPSHGTLTLNTDGSSPTRQPPTTTAPTISPSPPMTEQRRAIRRPSPSPSIPSTMPPSLRVRRWRRMRIRRWMAPSRRRILIRPPDLRRHGRSVAWRLEL